MNWNLSYNGDNDNNNNNAYDNDDFNPESIFLTIKDTAPYVSIVTSWFIKRC